MNFDLHFTKKRRRIKCIHVDGARDEGPSHLEVQFLWTKRHLEKGRLATLVCADAATLTVLKGADSSKLQEVCPDLMTFL